DQETARLRRELKNVKLENEMLQVRVDQLTDLDYSHTVRHKNEARTIQDLTEDVDLLQSNIHALRVEREAMINKHQDQVKEALDLIQSISLDRDRLVKEKADLEDQLREAICLTGQLTASGGTGLSSPSAVSTKKPTQASCTDQEGHFIVVENKDL